MIDPANFPISCTGDACTGDTVLFSEAVFGGSHRRPKYLGTRRIVAVILKDSYGTARQQHTFTIEVVESDGFRPLPPDTKTTRKGRNLYRQGTSRQPWTDETQRSQALADKHVRGDKARTARDPRISGHDLF